MKLLRIMLAVGLGLALLPPPTAGVQNRQLPEVTIGVVLDGPYVRRTGQEGLLLQEIELLASQDFEVQVPDSKRLAGSFTPASIGAALDQLLADPEVDLVVALGPVASHLAVQYRDLPKPVVAFMIIDADWQNAPREGNGSGVHNLNYIVTKNERDLAGLSEVVPFTRVAILVEEALLEAMPDAVENARRDMQEYGFEPVLVGAGRSVDTILEQIPSDVDVVYITPLIQLPSDDFARLVAGITERGLPSFSWWGEFEVRAGALATRTPDDFQQRVVRRAALNIQRILLGDDAGDLPVDYPSTVRLSINMVTAQALGIRPNWKVLTEAELIGLDAVELGRELSLPGAVQEAVATNLDLLVQEQIVAAGAEQVRGAQSNWWPQISLGLDAWTLDADRAEASWGILPQHALSGGMFLDQVLYSDKVWAGVSIEESVQDSRVQNRDSVELDITFDAAATYFQVLRAKTFERIQRENLGLTRTNLETAALRLDVGVASPGEVYRWESKIADDRRRVVDIQAARRLAEIRLNRVLNRPLDEAFRTAEATLEDQSLLTGSDRLGEQIENPWSFAGFSDFMVQESFVNSPELQSIDALKRAQERQLEFTERSFWLPDMGAYFNLEQYFARGGAGSDEDPPFGNENLVVDGTRWVLGFNASYDLFNGKAKSAERDQARIELLRLDLDRQATAQRIEEAVRSALQRMQASFAGIELARDSAEAAQRNYALVNTEYTRGTATILDLLDAQNTALAAQEGVAEATFQFFLDLTAMERAAGRYVFLGSPAEIDLFFDRLDEYIRTTEAARAAGQSSVH
jgi:outer membrane protein